MTLLVIALVFCPALLIFIRPLGSFAVAMLVSTGIACLVVSWLTWRKYSRLTLPSLEK